MCFNLNNKTWTTCRIYQILISEGRVHKKSRGGLTRPVSHFSTYCNVKIKMSLSESVSEWQGHLLSCSGQLKTLSHWEISIFVIFFPACWLLRALVSIKRWICWHGPPGLISPSSLLPNSRQCLYWWWWRWWGWWPWWWWWWPWHTSTNCETLLLSAPSSLARNDWSSLVNSKTTQKFSHINFLIYG